ncbi:Fructosamine/Ketosamine-3-kinase [Podospora australis]|uniref:protein-ribulosamine 3-kinase n=1 Tax=Podospora australis TaxID=1536484 RepID=A0AAN6WW59_9PEZI|nr:Fructosamine/Ketosamine-3-kinase [Podospora australis]
MLPNVDPAILSALNLEATSSKLLSHGGSGFSSTYKLVAAKDGKELTYFVKTGTGPDAEIMFRGEHASLNAIYSAVPSFCPKAYAHGPLSTSSSSSPTATTPGTSGSSGGKFFLVTDFLDLRSSASAGSGLSLAAKLAKLHTTPAPIPKGHPKPMFGFPVPTCCGSTVQDNSWKETWAEFYADNRLRGILRECIRKNGSDKELSDQVEKTATTVVPRLLRGDHLKGVVPVVVHGDLWSGNHGRGRIAGTGGVEEVVFDPSCCYGHNEYDLGIMKMFGGFGGSFWREYEKLVPKAEPKEEWEDRVALYELYHHLNHFALFGGGYRSGAISIMKRLISRYG